VNLKTRFTVSGQHCGFSGRTHRVKRELRLANII
jgi:hypothetical protein